MTVSYRVAAVSGGASAQLNRATRRARVRSSGLPPTSLGQAKKSDSSTPCKPVARYKLPSLEQVGGVGLGQAANVDAEGSLHHHADDGAQVGVADEQVVHLLIAVYPAASRACASILSVV